jgi:DNA-binding SARP family transcriptional activator
MDFRILGPLEVVHDGRAIPLGGARQRALLAVLLLHANETLTSDTLLDRLWGERPPATAAKTVQVHVSRLRKALGPEPIVTREHGYRLVLEPEQLDARRLDALLADARAALAAGEPERALPLLEAARGLWRGPPLADLAYEPFAQGEIARLADLRIVARELLVDARLALGGHADVVGELEALVAEHPFRERLRGQLMLALYRSDRQAEALQAYQDARRALVEELGIEPGEHLRELERAVLAQDPALALPVREAPRAPAPPRAPPRAARRLVSVVVAGPGGDGDPETLHALLERAGAIVARHGGTVEGVAGDALVGVFGLAELHEDDALRAARAALEVRDLGGLRVGAETGEAFVGGASGRATGAAFGAAARLQAQAPEDGVLVGERLAALLGTGARTDGGLLLALDDAAAGSATPFVGREAELAALHAAFVRARDGRACHAVTVAGPAGIGKSRLVREFLGGLGDAATVATGRCPSYGEDVTYRPLADVVRALGGDGARARILELVGGDEDLAGAVLRAAGLADGTAAGADETFWAVRLLLERVAAERPLVLVVEDVHWAEPTLLDLLDYLVAFSGEHPILVLSTARPDLAADRLVPGERRAVLALEPLDRSDAERLVGAAPGAARIVERAEGNPLFLEQLVAMGADGGEALPPTIHAVLAARIHRLDAAERDVLERASVEGVRFHVDGRRDAAGLAALARKGLVRAGGGAFRFTHALVRDAAYLGVPKERRAALHEEVAAAGGEDETVGHHLAEAHRLLRELGRDGEHERALAAAAATHLDAASDAALRRGDAPAAARLLEHAHTLQPAERAPRLGAALLEAGRLADADAVLTRVLGDPASVPSVMARARVERALVRLQTGAEGDDPGAAAAAALADADTRGRSRALYLRGLNAWIEGRAAEADVDWAQAQAQADDLAQPDLAAWRATAALFGPLPVPAAIARCRAEEEALAGSPVALARLRMPLAALFAMAGEAEEALRLVAEADAVLGELRGLRSAAGQEGAIAELLAGAPGDAEARLREGCDELRRMGERSLLADSAASLARVLLLRGAIEEADEACREARAAASPEDLSAQAGWRGVQARLLARDGRPEEAEALAREAVATAARTDFLSVHADALTDLAAVLRWAGDGQQADAAADAATAVYERKGDVVSGRLWRDHDRSEAPGWR